MTGPRRKAFAPRSSTTITRSTNESDCLRFFVDQLERVSYIPVQSTELTRSEA
jgi:hypothetical protein